MEEIISAALEAFAANAKKAQQQSGMGDERYQRILAELQARAAARGMPAAPPQPPQPAAVQAPPPAVRPKAAPPAKPSSAPLPTPARGGVLQGLLEDGNSLLRAVVAAELLSPPLALRESTNWQTKPHNDPST